MSLLDFPNPPLTVGQQFTATNGVPYVWDGLAWSLVAGTGTGASGPASGDLTGVYPGPQIAPGAVTDPKVGNVGWSKLIAPFLGVLKLDPRAAFAAGGGEISWHGNNPGDPNFDNTRASYIVRIDYVNDAFQIWRAPPPGTTWSVLFQVALSGITMNVPITLPANSVGSTQIADGSIQSGDIAAGTIAGDRLQPGAISRTQLGVNAVNGNVAYVANPTSFVSQLNAWQNYLILTPTLTTRGAWVHLWASACLTVTAPTAGGNVGVRWLRDPTTITGGVGGSTTGGTQIIAGIHQVAGAPGVYGSVPDLLWVDNPVAGAHNYVYQVYMDPGMTMISSNVGGGGGLAVEIG